MRCWFVVLVVGCGRIGFDDAPAADALTAAQVAQITLRGNHVCTTSTHGQVACWGSNDAGQLGRGTTSDIGEPGLVLGLDNITTAITGEFSSFAIDDDGALWAWGNNANGSLGLGTQTTAETIPRRVLISEPVVEVAAGQHHACARTAAGEVYCWGNNFCNQLGTGDFEDHATPNKVPGVSGVAHISVSDIETCFLDAAGGLTCVGGKSLTGTETCDDVALVPTAPAGLGAIAEVQGGCHASTCVRDATGAAWCWGDDVSGVLGNGSGGRRLDPTRVAVIANVTAIATGYNISCAATTTNALFCWGANQNGQHGTGTSGPQSNIPVQVPAFQGMVIDQLETGCQTACVRSGSDIFCWGNNEFGVIAGSDGDGLSPTRMTGLPF